MKIIQSKDKLIEIEIDNLSLAKSYELRVEGLKLIDKGYRIIVLNMRKILEIDTTGLGVIITLHKYLSERNGKVVLSNVSKEVLDIIKKCKIDKTLNIINNERN